MAMVEEGKLMKDIRRPSYSGGPVARLVAAILMLSVFCLALGGDMTPFKGWGTATVTGVNVQPTYTELTIEGTGQATHLGRFSRYEVLQINATGGVSGSIVFTAANGDTLTVAVAGQFISATTAVGTYTVTAGTGRFAASTGTADFVAVSLDGLHVTFRFNGAIS